MNKQVVIVAAKRTPIGSFLGSLSTISAPQLGAYAIKACLETIKLSPTRIDEVLMGNVLQAGTGQAPAKQAAILAGIPDTVPCTTVNKVCASGMKTIIQGAQSILLGDAEIIVAGGMENMSLVPHYTHLRTAKKFGESSLIDGLQRDGLSDAFDHKAMGVCADQCAIDHQISREEQDNYALRSYERAATAWSSKLFDKEITAVTIPQRKGEPITIHTDEEYTRIKSEKVPTLRPAFTKDGTVTAANASTINDGAGAVVLMSLEKANELGLTPLATIVSYADASQSPSKFTTTPAKALPIALEKAKLNNDDIDYFEINEAFSVVSLANIKLLALNKKKVNIHGGAVALGHPLGCSGVRILITLIHILQHKNATYGAAAICNGGGGASAMIIKRM